jgi:hypothetical protein
MQGNDSMKSERDFFKRLNLLASTLEHLARLVGCDGTAFVVKMPSEIGTNPLGRA